MRSDHWFYRVFLDFARLILTLAKMPNTDPDAYDFRAEELKEVAGRLDGVYEPKSAGICWLFAEAQFYLDPDFDLNWFRKVFHCLLNHSVREDWRAIVLFGSRAHELTVTYGMQEWFASGRLQRIYLDELPDYPLIPLELAVIKLAVVAKEDLIESAKHWVTVTREAELETEARRRAFSIILAIVVANFQQYSIMEIQTMLQLNGIRESKFFKEVEAIGMAEGLAEGLAKGEAEGRAKRDREFIGRLHARGMPVAEIAELTGISEYEVRTVIANIATIH